VHTCIEGSDTNSLHFLIIALSKLQLKLDINETAAGIFWSSDDVEFIQNDWNDVHVYLNPNGFLSKAEFIFEAQLIEGDTISLREINLKDMERESSIGELDIVRVGGGIVEVLFEPFVAGHEIVFYRLEIGDLQTNKSSIAYAGNGIIQKGCYPSSGFYEIDAHDIDDGPLTPPKCSAKCFQHETQVKLSANSVLRSVRPFQLFSEGQSFTLELWTFITWEDYDSNKDYILMSYGMMPVQLLITYGRDIKVINACGQKVSLPHDLVTNEWVHLAFVLENSSFKFYMNGQYMAGVTFPEPLCSIVSKSILQFGTCKINNEPTFINPLSNYLTL
jgi:hypothetical protein